MKQQTPTMTKSALRGRSFTETIVNRVQEYLYTSTYLTWFPHLFLFILLLLILFFSILLMFFFGGGALFYWVGFISRFLDEDQSFADKDKLARYGLVCVQTITEVTGQLLFCFAGIPVNCHFSSTKCTG